MKEIVAIGLVFLAMAGLSHDPTVSVIVLLMIASYIFFLYLLLRNP